MSGLLLGVVFLFRRRISNRQVRYISLMNDYFPLVLIFGIARDRYSDATLSANRY